MSVDQVTLFLALLAVVAQVATAGLLASVLAHAVRPSAGWPRRALAAVRPLALPLAGAVAGVATLGSLYLSEVADFPPCRLCWFQRIGMYPLVLLLGVATWRRDDGVRWYALPLATLGGLVAAYHVLVERFPSLESGACDPTNPCSVRWVEHLSYLTIPTMALSGFGLIVTLLALPAAWPTAATAPADPGAEAAPAPARPTAARTPEPAS